MDPMIIKILALAAAGVAGFYAAKFGIKVDTKIEDRRRIAGQLALALGNVGLKKLPEFLIDYSVGDYSTMLHKGKTIAEMATGDPTAFMKEFETVFSNLLDAKLKTEEGRILLAAKLQDAVKPNDSSVVAAAPKAAL